MRSFVQAAAAAQAGASVIQPNVGRIGDYFTKNPGAIRDQLVHVCDLAPTLLDLTGTSAPMNVDGVTQLPFDGASIVETLHDAHAPDPRSTQYFELLGSRSIIHDGWKATTNHVPAGLLDEEELLEGSRAFEEDRWHLYRMADDVAEVVDLAPSHPEVVAQLEALWRSEAERNHVLPLFDTLSSRFGALLGPRWPTGQSIEITPDGGPISDEALPLLFGGFTLTVQVSGNPTHGVLMALGDRHGGLSLILDAGHLVFTLAAPDATVELVSPAPVPADATHLGVAYTVDAGGALSLVIDGMVVRSIPFAGDVPVAFQHGGAQVRLGRDTGFPVTARYEVPGILDGTVDRLTIDASPDAVAPIAALVAAALHAD